MTHRDTDLRNLPTDQVDPRSITPTGNNGNPFWAATEDPPLNLGEKFIPRPKADDPRYAEIYPAHREAALANHQALWDREHERVQNQLDHLASIRARKDAELKVASDTAQAKRDERIAAERTALEARVKRTFLAQPGASESDYERLKDQLIDAELIRNAGSVDSRPRIHHAW